MGLSYSKRPDFIGKRFGRLVITGKHGLDKTMHLIASCQCDCGKETSARWANLSRGMTKSCGCLKAELDGTRALDLSGRKYGSLTVLGRSGSNSISRALWKCKCECGNEVTSLGVSLRRGDIVSCGCLSKQRVSAMAMASGLASRKPMAGAHAVLMRYKYSANKRGIPWELTDEEVFSLTSGDCHYCGNQPSTVCHLGTKKYSYPFVYNGIDRVDNTKGYVNGNCVSCCGTCNRAKQASTAQDFINMAKRIAARFPD